MDHQLVEFLAFALGDLIVGVALVECLEGGAGVHEGDDEAGHHRLDHRAAQAIRAVDAGAVPSAGVVEHDGAGRRLDHVRVRAAVGQAVLGAVALAVGLGGNAPRLRRRRVRGVAAELEQRGAVVLAEVRNADVALHPQHQIARGHGNAVSGAPQIGEVRVPALHFALAVVAGER